MKVLKAFSDRTPSTSSPEKKKNHTPWDSPLGTHKDTAEGGLALESVRVQDGEPELEMGISARAESNGRKS